MISGWLNIDKPVGVTSNQVIGYIKRELRGWGLGLKENSLLTPNPKTTIPKVGHAGTLDPLASGILPIAIGKMTKEIPKLMECTKTYVFTIKFGHETDTYDAEGKITVTNDKIPSLKEITDILHQFTGVIKQTPPKFSAIKINGKRAYDLARKGVEFEVKEREIEIFSLKILPDQTINHQPSTINLKCTCSKGTYIRSLGVDIARALGSAGYISYLRRTEYGRFTEENSVRLEIGEGKKLGFNGLMLSYLIDF